MKPPIDVNVLSITSSREFMASPMLRTPSDFASRLDVAIRAARAAGEILRDGFHSDTIAYDTKVNRNDPVTEYDLRADHTIVGIVRDSFPHDGILTEERGVDGISESGQWVIDPLDGTNNFSRHIPHFCVSIAFCDGNLPLVACIHDPIRNETFTAIRGSGAQRNDARLRVSDQQSMEGSFLSVGSSKHTALREATHKQMPPFFYAARGLRTTGSAALDLAYVAAGRFDASWYPELSWWDVAAGILLIEEAGGRCTDYCGDPLAQTASSVVASNGALHGAMLKLVEEGCDGRS